MRKLLYTNTSKYPNVSLWQDYGCFHALMASKTAHFLAMNTSSLPILVPKCLHFSIVFFSADFVFCFVSITPEMYCLYFHTDATPQCSSLLLSARRWSHHNTTEQKEQTVCPNWWIRPFCLCAMQMKQSCIKQRTVRLCTAIKLQHKWQCLTGSLVAVCKTECQLHSTQQVMNWNVEGGKDEYVCSVSSLHSCCMACTFVMFLHWITVSITYQHAKCNTVLPILSVCLSLWHCTKRRYILPNFFHHLVGTAF